MSDRVNRKLVHATRLRRAGVDALELILDGDFPLGELGDLGSGVAQFLGDFASCVIVNLDDLQLDLCLPPLEVFAAKSSSRSPSSRARPSDMRSQRKNRLLG